MDRLPALADRAQGKRISDDGDQTAGAGHGRVEETRRREEPEFGFGVFDVLVVAIVVVLARRFQDRLLLPLLLLVFVDASVPRAHRAQDDDAKLLA